MTIKSFVYPKYYNYGYTEVYGDGITSQYDTQRGVVYAPNSRGWTSVPDWKAKIAKGQDATTPFSGSKYTVEASRPMNITTVTPNPSSVTKQHRSVLKGDNPRAYPSFGSSSGFDVDSASNQALTAFWKKLRKTQVTMSGQVFLGEIREAVHMIKSPASALFNSHTGYLTKAQSLRRRMGTGKTAKAALADLWLEFHFGWKPFLSDIEDGLKAYQEVFKVREQTKIRAVGSSEVYVPLIVNNIAQIGHNGPYIRTSIIDRKVATVIYRAGLRDDRSLGSLGPTFQERTLKRFGLTLEEFIPTAWELTPWSFLIDYFTNIGDIVEAAATSTASVAWVNKTVIKENFRDFVVINDTDLFHSSGAYGAAGPNCYCFGDPGTMRTVSRFVDRSVLSSVPYPKFSVSTPTSPQKWANMLALLYSREKVERTFFKR